MHLPFKYAFEHTRKIWSGSTYDPAYTDFHYLIRGSVLLGWI